MNIYKELMRRTREGRDTRRVRCYVCKKVLFKDQSLYVGNDLYRHPACHAGSQSWLEHRKKSSLYQYFS